MFGIDKMYEDLEAEEETETTVNLSKETIDNIAAAILEKLNNGLTLTADDTDNIDYLRQRNRKEEKIMATWIKKIDTIVNSLATQALGSAVVGTDATFVSIGETVLSSETNKEAFFNALANRCYDTVISMRSYTQKKR